MGSLHKSLRTFIIGLCMGIADTVPGVSGGTIAYISGIYAELLDSLSLLTLGAIKKIFTKGPRAAFTAVNGEFLLPLFLGVGLALMIASRLILFILNGYPSLLFASFSSVVVFSLWQLRHHLEGFSFARGLLWIVGFLGCITLSLLEPGAISQISQSPSIYSGGFLSYLFISGAFAICAMLLPAISGAYILLLLGVYETVLSAVRDLNFSLIIVFSLGCLTGLKLFAGLFSHLIRRHEAGTMVFLHGLLAGSLVALWPLNKTPLIQMSPWLELLVSVAVLVLLGLLEHVSKSLRR